MVAWWLIPAFLAGEASGFFIAALMDAGRDDNG